MKQETFAAAAARGRRVAAANRRIKVEAAAAAKAMADTIASIEADHGGDIAGIAAAGDRNRSACRYKGGVPRDCFRHRRTTAMSDAPGCGLGSR